jgi:hypothetical protein
MCVVSGAVEVFAAASISSEQQLYAVSVASSVQLNNSSQVIQGASAALRFAMHR